MNWYEEITDGRFDGRLVTKRLFIVHMREPASVHTGSRDLKITVVRLLYHDVLHSSILEIYV